MNHKRLFRIYREERLVVRRRGGRKRALGTRAPMLVSQWPNDRWSVDFAADQFIDGRRLRIFVVVNDCTRECAELARRRAANGWGTFADHAAGDAIAGIPGGIAHVIVLASVDRATSRPA